MIINKNSGGTIQKLKKNFHNKVRSVTIFTKKHQICRCRQRSSTFSELELFFGANKRNQNSKSIFNKKMINVNDVESISEFLFTSIDYLYEHINKCDGIFRKSGHPEKINKIISKIDHGSILNETLLTSEYSDVFIIGCVIKKYLQEYPKYFFHDLYKEILKDKFGSNVHMVYQVVKIRKSLKRSLKSYERVYMYRLFEFLNYIVEKKEVTRMNSKALSILFTPILYSPNLVELMKNKSAFESALKITESLIKDFHTYFSTLITKYDKKNIREAFKKKLKFSKQKLNMKN